MYAYSHYKLLSESLTATGSTGAIVRRNEAKGGIEIKFADKPEDAVLANLRLHGIRRSFAHRVWWKKLTTALGHGLKELSSLHSRDTRTGRRPGNRRNAAQTTSLSRPCRGIGSSPTEPTTPYGITRCCFH